MSLRALYSSIKGFRLQIRTHNRKGFKKLLQKARGVDVLIVYKLDRISRKYDDVKHVIRDLKNLGLSFEIGGLSNINTGNELMNKALTDMLLSLPGYVAENERAYIRERQSADIEIAKKEGCCKGKPKKYSSDSKDRHGRQVYDMIVNYLKKTITNTVFNTS